MYLSYYKPDYTVMEVIPKIEIIFNICFNKHFALGTLIEKTPLGFKDLLHSLKALLYRYKKMFKYMR
jgi:hypothetical protein